MSHELRKAKKAKKSTVEDLSKSFEEFSIDENKHPDDLITKEEA